MALHPAGPPGLWALPSEHTQHPTASHLPWVYCGPSHRQLRVDCNVATAKPASSLTGLPARALVSPQAIPKTAARSLFTKLDDATLPLKMPPMTLFS